MFIVADGKWSVLRGATTLMRVNVRRSKLPTGGCLGFYFISPLQLFRFPKKDGDDSCCFGEFLHTTLSSCVGVEGGFSFESYRCPLLYRMILASGAPARVLLFFLWALCTSPQTPHIARIGSPC